MAFDPIEFLEHAVEIPSHETVGEMRTFLCETLRENDVEPTIDDAGNVLATRKADHAGSVDGPHVVLNTHIDTVTPHLPSNRDGDVLHGRGACDAKGPLAAMLAAFFACDPEDGRCTLAVTPDEESYSTGAAALVESLDLDARRDSVVVGEPTGLDVCNAAKGRFEGTLEIRGESAHAAEPRTGENAIMLAAPVIAALSDFDDRPDAIPPHSDLGAPTLTATTIRGGEATNQVPADCKLTLDRRSVPPETAKGFERALESYLSKRCGTDTLTFRLTERETPFLEAFETSTDATVIRALEDASDGCVRPFTAATEASYFAREVPTVVFGPGVLADEDGPVAHADREYVHLRDVERAAKILTETLTRMVREKHP